MNENLILSLNWYYAEEQKKKNIRGNIREMIEVQKRTEKKKKEMNYLQINQGLLEEVQFGE